MKKIVIVLAMHGGPPKDFPKSELAEFFRLRADLLKANGASRNRLEQRYAKLDAKMRSWPRTKKNDPFFDGSIQLAKQLRRVTGKEVILGYDEFCAPTTDEALDQAVERSPETVIVITPMMTSGGKHSEVEIPSAIDKARKRHPGTTILYGWPFKPSEIAAFLATQLNRFI